MTVTASHTGTRIDEIADGLFRISTPIPPSAVPIAGGFTFNQFLIVDDAPLLFHTGMRGVFPAVLAAVERVMPARRLRYVSFSHHEADEDGSVHQWLEVAPVARVVCGQVGAMLQGGELDRAPITLGDGEDLSLGSRCVRWVDAPHVPHGWDCGFLWECRDRTLFCSDLFTQPGADVRPVTDGDILGPSEVMRAAMEYYAQAPHTRATLERLAALEPHLLACMHGSSHVGDGGAALRALVDAVCGAVARGRGPRTAGRQRPPSAADG